MKSLCYCLLETWSVCEEWIRWEDFRSETVFLQSGTRTLKIIYFNIRIQMCTISLITFESGITQIIIITSGSGTKQIIILTSGSGTKQISIITSGSGTTHYTDHNFYIQIRNYTDQYFNIWKKLYMEKMFIYVQMYKLQKIAINEPSRRRKVVTLYNWEKEHEKTITFEKKVEK